MDKKNEKEAKVDLPKGGTLTHTIPENQDDGAESKGGWIEFKVFRDDPFDPFKPHSEYAVHDLAQNPVKKELTKEDETLLQVVGADLDRSLSVEEIVTYPIVPPKISDACLEELQQMPSWLRAMFEVRYQLLHDHFKHETVKFLRGINNRLESLRGNYGNYHGPLSGDIVGQIDRLENKAIEEFAKEMKAEKSDPVKAAAVAFRVVGVIANWKRRKLQQQLWEPHYVYRASVKLRRGLSVKPAAADIAFAEEDDNAHNFVEPDSSDDEGDHWKNIIHQEEIRKEAEAEVDVELRIQRAEEKRKQLLQKKTIELNKKKTKEMEKEEKSERKKMKKEAKKKGIKEDKNKKKESRIEDRKSKDVGDKDSKTKTQEKEKEKYVDKKEKKMKSLRNVNAKGDTKGKFGTKKPRKIHQLSKKERQKQLFSRGHFRRYSRLFRSGCGDAVDPPKRLEHHYRKDESFHAYIVTLVSSKYFKGFVVFVIFFNAIILAVETDERFEEDYETSEIFDELFLAFYLTEAIIKIYAHPYRYWTSGFNLFDFVILIISISKTIVDWFNIADISVLRVLLIVRALRVLRGISLSVQLQVLVTALVETIKTNIFSIVILLLLLVYIAAIVAFYLFGQGGSSLAHIWGAVPLGMLRMISFVTLDGWFDLMQEFEEVGRTLEGRIFNLICIVLGNFMFSNIFIAIIIMNISEATDVFRERIQREREEVIRRKKELVFRRQKLDMRQLLARQKRSLNADFFQMAGQFQKLLRHDDLVMMADICTSPLWMDSCYQCMLRTEHTSNLLMNLHRQMGDNLLDQNRYYRESKLNIVTIRRSRYNRYIKLKAKLALIKREILEMRGPPRSNLRIRYAKAGEMAMGDTATATNVPGNQG